MGEDQAVAAGSVITNDTLGIGIGNGFAVSVFHTEFFTSLLQDVVTYGVPVVIIDRAERTIATFRSDSAAAAINRQQASRTTNSTSLTLLFISKPPKFIYSVLLNRCKL